MILDPETTSTSSHYMGNDERLTNKNAQGIVQVVDIPHLVSACFSSFEVLLASVLKKEPELSNEITSSEISDATGRFRIWCSNIGAHQTGRSSLQYRLRDASHLRDRVQTLLQSLISSTENGKPICLPGN